MYCSQSIIVQSLYISHSPFDPPIPKLLMLALSLRVSGQGVGSTGTVSLKESKGIFGLGLPNLMLGGMTRFSRARTVLISDDNPLAPERDGQLLPRH